jgi:hypothetical protein
MRVNELRVGNLVYLDLGIPNLDEHSILAQDILDIQRKDPRTNIIIPIKLTNDRLVDFGFRKCGLYFDTDDIVITKSNDDRFHYQFQGKDKILDYVHQLQNLYFALTNEEL